MDMVYLPRPTPFVQAARELGIRAADGMEMLVQQGAVSFERWWGQKPSLEVMRASLRTQHGSLKRLPSLVGDLLDLFLPRGCVWRAGTGSPPEEPRLAWSASGAAPCSGPRRPPAAPAATSPRAPATGGGAPCLECAHWPEILVSARAAVVMEPPADALVHALKYGGWRSLGGFHGAPHGDGPVPHRWRTPSWFPSPPLRAAAGCEGTTRPGFWPMVVARELGVPRGGCSWTAPGRNPGEVGAPGKTCERAGSPSGCFPPPRSRIEGRKVILIDDVLTTGATALSAASTLAEKGVESVRLVDLRPGAPLRCRDAARSPVDFDRWRTEFETPH